MARWKNLRIEGDYDMRHLQGREWQLIDDLTAVWADGALRVPAGYVCDLATIPALARVFFAPHGAMTRAAVFHDALYTDDAVGGSHWSRKDADDFFLRLMATTGVGWLARNLAWAAVRVGGWAMWRDGK